MSDCERCEPGWCKRHGVDKSPRMVELCGSDDHPGYWHAWENGYGPGQKGKGLGDTVARAINTVSRGKIKPCGGCTQRRHTLNQMLPSGQETATAEQDATPTDDTARNPLPDA
jgi:hypothetical protein